MSNFWRERNVLNIEKRNKGIYDSLMVEFMIHLFDWSLSYSYYLNSKSEKTAHTVFFV